MHLNARTPTEDKRKPQYLSNFPSSLYICLVHITHCLLRLYPSKSDKKNEKCYSFVFLINTSYPKNKGNYDMYHCQHYLWEQIKPNSHYKAFSL